MDRLIHLFFSLHHFVNVVCFKEISTKGECKTHVDDMITQHISNAKEVHRCGTNNSTEIENVDMFLKQQQKEYKRQ